VADDILLAIDQGTSSTRAIGFSTAGDAVALYRVAQESLGRTRGGDGPVLIECVAYGVEGSGGGTPGDSLVQMKEFLVGRKVCTKAWLERAGEGLRRRIAAARQ